MVPAHAAGMREGAQVQALASGCVWAEGGDLSWVNGALRRDSTTQRDSQDTAALLSFCTCRVSGTLPCHTCEGEADTGEMSLPG